MLESDKYFTVRALNSLKFVLKTHCILSRHVFYGHLQMVLVTSQNPSALLGYCQHNLYGELGLCPAKLVSHSYISFVG